MTMNDIKEKLAKADADAVAKGAAVLHDLSPSAFLLRGLDLEESQYVVYILLSSKANVCDSQVFSSKGGEELKEDVAFGTSISGAETIDFTAKDSKMVWDSIDLYALCNGLPNQDLRSDTIDERSWRGERRNRRRGR